MKPSTPITPNGYVQRIRCCWDILHTMGSKVSGHPWQMIPTSRPHIAHWEISRLDNAIDKVVISDSLTPEQTEPCSITPASSAAQTLTSKLPNSNAKPAKTSWFLVAEHSGTTCWLTIWLTNYT